MRHELELLDQAKFNSFVEWAGDFVVWLSVLQRHCSVWLRQRLKMVARTVVLCPEPIHSYLFRLVSMQLIGVISVVRCLNLMKYYLSLPPCPCLLLLALVNKMEKCSGDS